MKKIKIIKIFEYFAYLIILLFALLAISSKLSIGGFKLLVVRSGSMEPSIKTGSMVVGKSSNDYNIGDVVTFKNADKPKETTTHRITNIEYRGSNKIFTTKGDANNGADPEKITQDRIVGKVIVKILYFGYVASFARSLPGLIIIIIIPATIIIYEETKKIHHEAKEIIKKRKEKRLNKTLNKKKSKTENKGENNETS